MITIKEIIKAGKEKANDSLQVVPDLKVGEYVAQGDVNFIALPSLPEKAIAVNNPSLQLAPGNTKGSRHCLKSLENVKVYKLPNQNPLQGYILCFTGETIVTHPEHGDQLWRKGIVLVSYQRQFSEDLKRISD